MELFKTLSKFRGAVFTEKYGDEVCKVWFEQNVYFAIPEEYIGFEKAQAIALMLSIAKSLDSYATQTAIAQPI